MYYERLYHLIEDFVNLYQNPGVFYNFQLFSISRTMFIFRTFLLASYLQGCKHVQLKIFGRKCSDSSGRNGLFHLIFIESPLIIIYISFCPNFARLPKVYLDKEKYALSNQYNFQINQSELCKCAAEKPNCASFSAKLVTHKKSRLIQNSSKTIAHHFLSATRAERVFSYEYSFTSNQQVLRIFCELRRPTYNALDRFVVGCRYMLQ